MAQGTPDIRVLVDVEGGASIDGKSGEHISNTLEKLAKNISAQKRPHITFDVDFQNTAKKVYKQLNEIVKSIKVEPIDLQIRTNQSSIGSFAENEYKKLIDSTKGKKAKANIIAHIEEKNALKELAVQKAQDVMATEKQTKANKESANQLSELIEKIGFVNSTQAQKQQYDMENSFNKFNVNESTLNRYKEFQSLVANLSVKIEALKSNLGTEDVSKVAEDLLDPKNAKELAELLPLLTKYETELKQIGKLANLDSPKFLKEIRNATNDKNLEGFIVTLSRFEKMNDKFKSNSGLLAQFESIKAAAFGFKTSGDFSDVDVKNLRTQLSKLNIDILNLGLNGQSALGKLRAQIDKLGVSFGASTIMMGAWRQVNQMTTNVIELDTVMTELKKVTDETDITYSKFLDNAEIRAKKLGVTLTDTIRSTADAARMGYSLGESEILADTFNIYKNVGDGIKDIEQASSTVISTMKAFDIEAKNSMQIVDAYNEVSNNFAVRSDEIGLAVADMGAAFAGAGNSMEESIAVYTGMNEIIQDWSKSSTAMRTISARLRNTAGELEKLGIDSEGAAESITKLQTQLLNITNGKVDIMASPDKFKNTTQILRELSAVWDSLTDKDRDDVTRLVSGTSQQSTLQAVLTNWEQVEAAITTAMDSSGSAYTENEKYLDSVKGKASQFQAQYEALSNTIINSELIKLTYDSGTGLLGFLDGVIKKLGTIPTLATIAAGALSAINNTGISNVKYALPYPIYTGTVAIPKNAGNLTKHHLATA